MCQANFDMRFRQPQGVVFCVRFLLAFAIADQAVFSDSTFADDEATIAAIEQLGGSIRPISTKNSDELEVEFHLSGRDLTDQGLAQLAALRNIVSLNLRDTKITGAGLVHLKGLTKLRWLHLERTEIGDTGVEHLAELTNLEYLNLYGTNITDKSLDHLAGLKNLRRLYVWQTGVTADGAERLAAALPNLKVVRGVDLSKLPKYSEPEPPKPKEDLKWIAANSAGEAPKSGNGINTQVFFENKSEQRVKLYWVSFGGELKLYAVLEPGAKRQQNSYSRHTWFITDENETPLGYFIVTDEISRAVIPKQGS